MFVPVAGRPVSEKGKRVSDKKLIGLVALAVIGYELWKRQQAAAQPATSSSIAVNTSSPIPVWAQQLEATTPGGASTTVTSSSTIDPIQSLLTLPQGPGGTPQAIGNVFGTDCILG